MATMSASKVDRTLPVENFSHLFVDEEDQTLIWVRPVYFGIPIPPFAADRVIPPRPRVGHADQTLPARPGAK
jgi:hypothetical protein